MLFFFGKFKKSKSHHEINCPLKQSSIRWIRYDVINGTQIGITSFESTARLDKVLTKVSDNNREEFVSVLDRLNANGGTCLGTGLMKGMDVSRVFIIVHAL